MGGHIDAVPVQRALRQRAGGQGHDAECCRTRGNESTGYGHRGECNRRLAGRAGPRIVQPFHPPVRLVWR
jgi:hypothetical protein